jgi:hypothetical protein
MTLRLDLSPDLESRLNAEAARLGLPPDQYALSLLEDVLVASKGSGASLSDRREPEDPDGRKPILRAPTARELLAMSPEERSRVLSAQAHDAEPLYRADLT